MNYNFFSLFNHFFLAKTPEEAVFVFEVTCSHAFPPPTAGCFPHYKAGAGGWGSAARQYPSSSTDPPNTGIPRTGPYHPPPQPTLIPSFPDISHFLQSRCSKKCIIQLQQNSHFYSKLHALSKIHSRLSAVIKSHGKYDSWHTFQEVWLWPQGAEAVSFKIHPKHFSWRNFVRENGFWTYLIYVVYSDIAPVRARKLCDTWELSIYPVDNSTSSCWPRKSGQYIINSEI